MAKQQVVEEDLSGNGLTVFRFTMAKQYDNAGNTEAASNAVRAILKYSASTDKNPKHDLCPPGESSRCKWQVAKAK